jgi:hypothetical protein
MMMFVSLIGGYSTHGEGMKVDEPTIVLIPKIERTFMLLRHEFGQVSHYPLGEIV